MNDNSTQNAHLRAGLEHEHHASDAVLMADFTAWYCAAHHKKRPKQRVKLLSHELLSTPEKRLPEMCEECAEFVRYSEKRTAYCRQVPKPFCAHCPIKCYSPQMQKYSREVMRYSGPRSIFSRHAFAAIKHLLEQKKH